MHHTVLRIGFLLLVAGSLFGCSGSGGTGVTATSSSIDTSNPTGDVSIEQEYTDLEGWYDWLADPGVPGVNYAPDRITVSYLPGATVPKGISSVVPEGFVSAAEQPNAILRQEPGYEAVTDAIALRYGLEIDNQVYWGRVRVAGFEVPEGVDADEVIAAVRSEFSGAVRYVHYAQLYHQDDYVPDDPDYVSSNDHSETPLWGLHRINAGEAWEVTRGKATEYIAVVDTGVRITHEELANVESAVNYFSSTKLDLANNDSSMEDSDGHGTFIAGEVTATGNNGRTIVGLAHLNHVIPVKITNGGSAYDNMIIAGCALGFNLGARSVSLSFGDYHTNPSMEDLVNQIWDNGGIFVASAGNDGDKAIGIDPHYPSDYPNSISVGSTKVNDSRSQFSNYGQYVDIAAPGEYIKSCEHTGDSHYVDWSQGTSFASPLVAAAAALLWSYDEDLTNTEVRNLLESTAQPTTGFTQGDVGRLDIGAAMSQLAGVRVQPPQPDRLVYSGEVTMTPTVTGEADYVEAYFNGVLTETRDTAPWNFTFDTSAIDFGYGQVRFIGYNGTQQSVSTTYLLVDNTFGNFPVTETFEETSRSFQPLDVKNYSRSLLESIKSYPGTEWTVDEVAFGGSGVWNDETGETYGSSTISKYFGTGGDNYDSYEIDALISRRIDLTAVATPTMVFYHRYNIEDGGSDYDRAFVYVTTDYGRTFTPATLNGGGEARFSGYQDSWSKVEIDLSDYSDDQIQVVFVFESDPVQSGELPSLPSGWWLDEVTISMDYIEDMPSISNVSVEPYTTYGLVPELTELSVNVGSTSDVADMTFILDCVPLGVADDPNDIAIAVGAGPFNTVFTVPGEYHNQVANLLIEYRDEASVSGPTKVIPVYIFNQPGDVNLDGEVDLADLAGFTDRFGLAPGDDGYLPFYDGNYDGVINELDAALVGYNYTAAQ